MEIIGQGDNYRQEGRIDFHTSDLSPSWIVDARRAVQAAARTEIAAAPESSPTERKIALIADRASNLVIFRADRIREAEAVFVDGQEAA